MIGQPQKIGRYSIVECVGRGGMGVLYRAHDPMLERDVAIKLMLVDFSADNTARERFQREAKAIARLQHRNVVTIHELGEEENTPFIVMEFLGGRDLERIMRARTPLSLDEKLDIVIQLCAGLSFAHEHGIVHRDIKPGNVRVLDDSTVKILDFGIAKLALGGTTQVGMVMGSANYMAPEQASDEAVDGRADLFSTGVLLYELLSGKKPFQGESPTATLYQIVHNDPPSILSIVPALPPQLDEIIRHALKKHPDERYSRATEMAADLQIVRAMIQSPSMAGMPVLAETEILTNPAPSFDRPFPSGAVGRLSNATLRPPAGGTAPGIEVTLDRSGSASTAAIGANRQSALAMLVGAVAVAAVVVAVLVIRNNAGDGGSANTSTSSAAVSGGAGSSAKPPPIPTPPPPAAPTMLMVTSDPDGARILVDGADTGKTTPASVAIEGALPKRLQLTLKGYVPTSALLSDVDLKGGKIDLKLNKEIGPVRVTVTGSYPFDIVQGSRVVSAARASHEIVVQPGQTGFRARNSEYFLNEPLDVNPLRPRNAFDVPELGTVYVFSIGVERGCRISIDGTSAGDPPIKNQPMAAGSHTFSIKCDDGRGDSQRISVPASSRTDVTLNPRD